MDLRRWHNCKPSCWLLALTLLVMASISNASWQCPDGHACPPGCTMTHGPASASRACCKSETNHCPLCPEGSQLRSQGTNTLCTSSQCLLRFEAHPDAVASAVHSFDVVAPAILPAPVFAPLLVPTTELLFSPAVPRAPPRQGKTRPSAPRAPPVLL